MNIMYRALFIPLIGLLCAACTGGTWLHSYKPLPEEGWERRDTVCFALPQTEQDISGTLAIGLRMTAPVGMQDIVLAVEQSLETPAAHRCDTVRCPLTDAEGYALGQGVNTIQYETPHIPFFLCKGQSGTVRIRHLMTDETVPGITELGIRVSR